jgi:hypothetical protein
MKTENKEQLIDIEIGLFFYHINDYGKFLRKILWKNEYYFEWNGGWAEIEKLIPNNNKKSNVKFILND